MSFASSLDFIRRSVALRLSLLFAGLFALGFALIFGLTYWFLGDQLEEREHQALDLRLRQYRDIYQARGLRGLQERVFEDRQSPHVRSLYIRIFTEDDRTVWASVPPDWIDPEARRLNTPDEWARLAERGVAVVRVPRDELEDVVLLATRLRDGLLLEVARSTDNRTALLEPMRRLSLKVGAAVMVLAFAGGVIVAWRTTRPIRQIAATARNILATGALNERVPLSLREDELAELVQCFNNVLDRNAGLIRAMREALDNVAHDLRTPLTALRGSAELAIQRTSDPVAQEALGEGIERVDEVLRLLRALMEIAEAEAGVLRLARERLDLRELAASAVDLYREVAEGKNLQLKLVPGEALPAWGDSVRLRQAVANLIDNAIKYTPEGGQIEVACRREGTQAVLAVRDSGPGVPAAEQARIWERLYRGDASRTEPGLGLGLSMVRAITEAHGGRATVSEAPGGGALFSLTLPLEKAEPEADPTPRPALV